MLVITMTEKIVIWENPIMDKVYLELDRKIQASEKIEKPTFKDNECYPLNTKNIIKILQLFASKKILVRYGTAFFKNNDYWKVNLENSKNLPEYLRKNRKSLHRLVYAVYYGIPQAIIAKDYHIHHLCGNPCCMNPLHMFGVHGMKHKAVEWITEKLRKEKKSYSEMKYILRIKLNKGEL